MLNALWGPHILYKVNQNDALTAELYCSPCVGEITTLPCIISFAHETHGPHVQDQASNSGCCAWVHAAPHGEI